MSVAVGGLRMAKDSVVQHYKALDLRCGLYGKIDMGARGRMMTFHCQSRQAKHSRRGDPAYLEWAVLACGRYWVFAITGHIRILAC